MAAMDEERFWGLIRAHVKLDDDGRPEVDALEDALAGLSLGDIAGFNEMFTRLYCASYSWKLWGAGYLINGGCSDDGFDYFRACLIAMGREVFERALEDPDTLAEVVDEDVECEDMLYVADRAYERATGGKKLEGPPYEYPPLGDGWDFDDVAEMKRRYPRLAGKFLQ